MRKYNYRIQRYHAVDSIWWLPICIVKMWILWICGRISIKPIIGLSWIAIQFAVTCVADYGYTFPPFFSGDGIVTAVTQNSRLETVVQVQSLTGFWEAPPSQVSVLQCSLQLDITDMNFDGGVVASILDMLQGVLNDVIVKAVEDGTYYLLVHLGNRLFTWWKIFAEHGCRRLTEVSIFFFFFLNYY